MDNEEKFRQYVLLFIFLGLCYVFFSIFYRDTSEIDNQKLVIRTNVVSPTPVEDPFAKNNEITCLAKNMYFEARNEGTAGVLGVTNVVLNRVKSDLYPNTICGVIEDAKISQWWLKEKGLKKPIKHMCQFSWYCDGKSDEIKDHYTYNQLYVLAEGLVASNFKTLLDITDGALYYHADYVKPKWSRHFEKTVKIGRHIFYRRR